jgi:hypothetical protein
MRVSGAALPFLLVLAALARPSHAKVTTLAYMMGDNDLQCSMLENIKVIVTTCHMAAVPTSAHLVLLFAQCPAQAVVTSQNRSAAAVTRLFAFRSWHATPWNIPTRWLYHLAALLPCMQCTPSSFSTSAAGLPLPM